MVTSCVGVVGRAGVAGDADAAVAPVADGPVADGPVADAGGCAVDWDCCFVTGAGLRAVVGLRLVWPTAVKEKITVRTKGKSLREGFIPKLMVWVNGKSRGARFVEHGS